MNPYDEITFNEFQNKINIYASKTKKVYVKYIFKNLKNERLKSSTNWERVVPSIEKILERNEEILESKTFLSIGHWNLWKFHWISLEQFVETTNVGEREPRLIFQAKIYFKVT